MEVTKYNFPSVLENLRKEIPTCKFISLDIELSGLRTRDDCSNSLFDSVEERYNKHRKGTQGIIATQIGLSIFHFDRDLNTYASATYTFHLCPQFIGSINQTCTFEASVLTFLEKHNFDFNKFAYEGIPYLNKYEEISLTHILKNGMIENFLRYEDVERFWEIKNKVVTWMTSASDKDTLRIKENSILQLYIIDKLKSSFPILTFTTENSEIIIGKNLNINSNSQPATKHTSFNDDVLNYALGFSHVVKLLEDNKKPLVFHNAFGDIAMFYNQFIAPLPASYKSFKREVHKLFPEIYDSKYIILKLKHLIKKDSVFDNSSLQNVYTFFNEKKGKYVCMYSPRIKMKDDFDTKPWFHQAGWDSYCTGFCFIKICHWLGSDNSGSNRPLTTNEHFNAVKIHRNNVYLSRASQPHLCLNENDPANHRPPYLYMRLLKNQILDLPEIASMLSRYGSVDVRKYGKTSVLIAVTGTFTCRKIFEEFKHSKDYDVSVFNPIKHSPILRVTLWSGFFLSSISTMALIFYQLKKL
ncbi:pre-piRNA 3'-exonuclease trimmer-like [Arctopsyche grandis]|uniref:pre-piRNA 3'-exonuclease trimmer-like n=1 Tax=Arctopsyche grandis TaxID=121162 RepID=UPI00406D8995